VSDKSAGAGWQPARFKPVHKEIVGKPDWITEVEYAELKRRVLRVRPSDRKFNPSDMREIGCDAEKFYSVHPEDIMPGCGDLICEHEILTD